MFSLNLKLNLSLKCGNISFKALMHGGKMARACVGGSYSWDAAHDMTQQCMT